MNTHAGNPFSQSFDGNTTIHPLGLVALLAMGVLMLILPRRYATWPVIVIVCFVCSAQRVVIAGADFTLLRLMVVFSTLRFMINGEWSRLRWNGLDTAVMTWAIFFAAIPVLRVGPQVLMTRLGLLYDAIGLYFLFRILLRDWDDVRVMIRGLMWASLAVGAFVLLELQTSHNVFSIFGGVPAQTAVRDGRIRAQGAFEHPILLGTFFATFLPLAAACWWQDRRGRKLIVASCIASILIVFASASATPLTALIIVVIGAAMFPLRYRMRTFRWGLAFTTVLLHLVMIAPVWHLIARFSVVGGNSSWHRFQLVDGAIKHFDEWWLVGSDKGTGHWGYFTFDITNFYIVLGIHGGVLVLALFIVIIAVAYREVGRLWRRYRFDRRAVILAWALGVALSAHVASLFGVAYFGQMWMAWYLLLGVIGSLAEKRPMPVTVRQRRETRIGSPGQARSLPPGFSPQPGIA